MSKKNLEEIGLEENFQPATTIKQPVELFEVVHYIECAAIIPIKEVRK
jgi:hypothetical protein